MAGVLGNRLTHGFRALAMFTFRHGDGNGCCCCCRVDVVNGGDYVFIGSVWVSVCLCCRNNTDLITSPTDCVLSVTSAAAMPAASAIFIAINSKKERILVNYFT